MKTFHKAAEWVPPCSVREQPIGPSSSVQVVSDGFVENGQEEIGVFHGDAHRGLDAEGLRRREKQVRVV